MTNGSIGAAMNYEGDPLDLLVVAPHPDDAEIGVGGVIVSAVSAGRRVGVLELTDGEPTPRGSVDRRAAETAAATEVLPCLSLRRTPGLRVPGTEAKQLPEYATGCS